MGQWIPRRSIESSREQRLRRIAVGVSARGNNAEIKHLFRDKLLCTETIQRQLAASAITEIVRLKRIARHCEHLFVFSNKDNLDANAVYNAVSDVFVLYYVWCIGFSVARDSVPQWCTYINLPNTTTGIRRSEKNSHSQARIVVIGEWDGVLQTEHNGKVKHNPNQTLLEAMFHILNDHRGRITIRELLITLYDLGYVSVTCFSNFYIQSSTTFFGF